MNKEISRRAFLKGMMAAGCCAVVPGISSICEAYCRQDISFYHTHTGESLTVPFPIQPNQAREIQQAINYFLRDFRTEEQHPIDLGLMEILYEIKRKTGGTVYEVISGYRSPKTNAMLRKKSRGVARKSLHLKGKAIDIRLRGVNTLTVRNCALALRRGGVGYYRKSDFVHVDTGRFRAW